MYNELKAEIELEKEKLQKDMDKYLEIDTETDKWCAILCTYRTNGYEDFKALIKKIETI